MPGSLLIQFAKVTNDFYLINGIFQSIPSISTNSPLASFVPMAFIVLLGMLKELLADLKRWQDDKRTNQRAYTRVGPEGPVQIQSQDIRVGDILELHDGQMVPADCVLLSTQQESGQCFVQTASLDGERNLKPKVALRGLQDNLPVLLKSLGSAHLEIECEEPDRNLYYFRGNLRYSMESIESKESGRNYEIDLKQFLHSVRIPLN